MRSWDDDLLEPAQAAYAREQLGDPLLIEDLSWGIVDTRVLHVRAFNRDVIVKAAGEGSHHIGREITAHTGYTAVLANADRMGRFVAADRELRVIISTYQPGRLVTGSGRELDIDVHKQAGALLRLLHEQESRVDEEYEYRVTAKATDWLEHPHRIPPDLEREARSILDSYRPRGVVVVPTHGDWQPRNWLIDGDRVRVIDFGRFGFRPAATDLCRLAMNEWRHAPELESIFVESHGMDPRECRVWNIDLLREAIGTACWAHQVGDVDFEAYGLKQLEKAVARF